MAAWCLVALAWTACESTETGNPPVVDSGRFALMQIGGDVEIVGAPGAVRPGGSTIEITDSVSGHSASAQSAPDGSFALTLRDVDLARASFTIRVSSVDGMSTAHLPSPSGQGGPRSGPEREAETTADAASAAPFAQPDAGPSSSDAAQPASLDAGTVNLSCAELDQAVDLRLQQALGAPEVECTQGAACTPVATRTSCLESCPILVASGSVATVEAAVAQVERELCTQHKAQGCAVQTEQCADVGDACVDERCSTPSGPTVISTGRNP